MKNINFTASFKSMIYKTLILQEFTYCPNKLFYLVLLCLNEIQVLKCCLLVLENQEGHYANFIDFLIYFFRPSYYFATTFETQYIWIVFALIQLFYILWAYLAAIKGAESKENFIQLFQQYQSSSTYHYILATIWKCFFLFLQEFLGFLIIEGNLILIFEENYNKFNQVIAFIIIFQILILMIVADLFLSLSLRYIPNQLNFYVQTSILTLIQKLIKFAIISIFISSISEKKLLVLFMSLVYSIIEIQIQLKLRVKLDKYIISTTSFIQSLIICVSIQEIINNFYGGIKENSSRPLQFLWIVLSILLQYSVNKMLNMNFFIHLDLKLNSHKEPSKDFLFNCKYKLYEYQNFQQNQDYQFRMANLFLLNQHRYNCIKKSCFCNNQNYSLMKLESVLIKENLGYFKYFLEQSQSQSSSFFLEFIQLLIVQGKYFEALNWTQKLLNSFTKRTLIQRQFQYFKGQVSLQHKLILKLLYQQLLLNIKTVIQSRTTQTFEASNLQKAIYSLQQKVDSQKSIQEELDQILFMKIDYLSLIQHKEKIVPNEFDRKTHKIIKKIETFKRKLQYNFKQVPTHNNQSLLLYFQVEILNDLINSQTLSSMSSQLNDEDIKNETNFIIDQLSSQFQIYSFALMDEDNIQFLPNYINKNSKQSTQKYSSFNEMIPSSLLEIHKYYVRDFFQNGKNKFYLNVNESLLQLQSGMVSSIDMCMNVQFDLQLNRLILIAFVKKKVKNNQTQILILDENFKIKEMTKGLYQKFSDACYNQTHQFLDQTIFTFIPHLNESHLIQDKNIGVFELLFFKNNRTPVSTSSLWSGDKFYGNLNVKARRIRQKYVYYVLTISEIRSEKKGTQLSTTSLPQIDFDEKEVINIPLENELVHLEVQEILSHQPMQQLSSRLDTNRPFLFTSLSQAMEGIELQMETNKNLQSQPSNNSSGVSIHQKKYENDEQKEKNFEDQGSQISSVAAVKRSLFYKQYLVINQLIFSNKFPLNIKRFNLLILLFLVIEVLNLALLINQVQQLKVYQELLSLLSIKYDIYEPIQSFLNTRYTIVSLNQALQTQVINQTVFNQLVVFPRSNLVRGYDDLKGNIFDVLSRQEFQSFLKDKYFESHWYENTAKSIQRNITFRSGILALLEYQYDFKLAYTIKTLQTDGPYFFYSYENYISLLSIFTQLNDDILDQLILELQKQSSNVFLITVPLSIFSGFISILYSIFLIKQRKLKNKLLNLTYQQDNEILIYETTRLKLMQQYLYGNLDQIYHYNLDVSCYDLQLKQLENDYLKQINKKQNKVSGKKRSYTLTIYNYVQMILLILNIAVLQTIYSITLESLNNYLDKSQNTAMFYESLSSTGVDVLIVYSEREVLYRRAFILFFTQKDIQNFLSLIDESLVAISNFQKNLVELNQQDYLLDDNSMQLFDDVSQNSLCNYLPEEFQNVSTTLCPNVMLGVLNNGLQQTLNFMYNSIFSEKQINNFTARDDSQVPVRELEGATFTAKVIKVLVETLYNNIYNFTNQILINFTVAFSCSIILETLVGILVIYRFSIYENDEIDNLRKIVYLLPKATLLFDDGFQRQIKNIIQIGEIV